jgi:hypothetical protein
MKTIRLFEFFCVFPFQSIFGGQSQLETTYQPLDAFTKSEIEIVSVTCLHWYANSSSSSVDLIGVRNVPPSDNPEEANEDLNLASVCGVGFSTSDLGLEQEPLQLTLDATKFNVPKRYSSHAKEDIIRACLECLRLCTPEKLKNTPVTLKCGDADHEWLAKIVAEFNASDRSKVFFPAQNPKAMHSEKGN